MAVMAFGCFLRAKPGGFAMISVEISFSNFLMALAAGVKNAEPEVVLLCIGNPVRGMAVLACGQVFGI
jgi:hypothetical protein